jgi:hypothetical protein
MREEKENLDILGRVSELCCNLMHDSPMWPIHEQYQCRSCGRHYVPWATGRRVGFEARSVRPGAAEAVGA